MSLKKNTLWNLMGSGLPLMVAALTIPFIIERAGVEAFGILTLVWALIGYFSLFDFGLGRALTQQVAKELSLARTFNIPSLVKSGVIFTAGAGVLGGVGLFVLANPLAFKWLKVSAGMGDQAMQAFLIAGLGIPLTTMTSGLRGVLEAYEDFRMVNILRTLLGTANFALPAVTVLIFGPSLTWMVFGLVVARCLNLVAHFALIDKKLPKLWWSTGKVERKKLVSLFKFGAWMTVSNIVSPLMVTADRFLISGVLGTGLVAYYSVPSEMMQRLLVIPVALTGALFPRLVALQHTNAKEASIIYNRSLIFIAGIMFPVCLMVAIFSKLGLSLWLGDAFASKASNVVVILSIGIFFNGLAGVPFAKIQAAGHARMTAVLHCIELVLYIGFLYILVIQFGLVGAAVAWVLRVTLDFFLLMFFARRY